MDIYDYINSRDVAAYCREINKTWNTFEMAVIIGRSERPMLEKHAAWRELIADYPDMPTQKNIHHDSYDSVHKKLAEVIEYEERALELFKTSEQGAVYAYRLWGDDRHFNSVYTDFGKAFSTMKEYYEREEVSQVVVEKIYLNAKGSIEVVFDYDGNPTKSPTVCCEEQTHAEWFPDIDMTGWCDYRMFDDVFYIDIPAPFKRGDILIQTNSLLSKDKIFVLEYLDRDNEKMLAKCLSGEMCDGTDLVGWGLYVGDDGLLYADHAHDHDCFEYYTRELTGKQRLLKYVSLYYKNEIALPALLTLQCRLMLEKQLHNDLRLDFYGLGITQDIIQKEQTEHE
jgi:hypothetical protein